MIRTTTLRLRTIRWKGEDRNARNFAELSVNSKRFIDELYITGKCYATHTINGITLLICKNK